MVSRFDKLTSSPYNFAKFSFRIILLFLGFGHISTDLSFSLTDERLSLTETLISSKTLMERATAQAELVSSIYIQIIKSSFN